MQAFPVPEVFFSVLIDGYYTLAEAYFLSLPYLSWQMVLVGDPLYRPFMNRVACEWGTARRARVRAPGLQHAAPLRGNGKSIEEVVGVRHAVPEVAVDVRPFCCINGHINSE